MVFAERATAVGFTVAVDALGGLPEPGEEIKLELFREVLRFHIVRLSGFRMV